MRTKQGGHEIMTGFLPEWYDLTESDVTIEFDWNAPDPPTRTYPGDDGGLWLTEVRYEDGTEIDLDMMPADLWEHLKELAEGFMAAKERPEDDPPY